MEAGYLIIVEVYKTACNATFLVTESVSAKNYLKIPTTYNRK